MLDTILMYMIVIPFIMLLWLSVVVFIFVIYNTFFK